MPMELPTEKTSLAANTSHGPFANGNMARPMAPTKPPRRMRRFLLYLSAAIPKGLWRRAAENCPTDRMRPAMDMGRPRPPVSTEPEM